MSIVQNILSVVDTCDIATLIRVRSYKPGMLFKLKEEFFSLDPNITLEHILKPNDICLYCEEEIDVLTIFGVEKPYTRMKFMADTKLFHVSTFSLTAHMRKEKNVIEIFDAHFERIECARGI